MFYLVDRTAVVLKPTEVFLDWLNKNLEKEGEPIELTLSQVQSNSRIFLLPAVVSPEAAMALIGEHYQQIFELEVATWFEEQDYWPENQDLATFWEFFELEVSDEVIDLVDDELQNRPLTSGTALNHNHFLDEEEPIEETEWDLPKEDSDQDGTKTE